MLFLRGWAFRTAQPLTHPLNDMKTAILYGATPFRKRGRSLDTFKRQKTNNLSKNTHPAQRILQAIKTAEDEHQLGGRETSPVTLIVEDMGIVIGVIRREKEYSRDKLAAQIGVSPEILFALEAGILHPLRFCEVLPSVLEAIGIPLHKLAETLRKENAVI